MNEFMSAQRKKIEIDKCGEGFRLNSDPGQEYIIFWILQNGAWFRRAWEESLCKSCSLSSKCGYKVQQKCDIYNKSSKKI